MKLPAACALAVVALDAVLVVKTGLPVSSLLLGGCLAVLFLLWQPIAFLLGIIFVNSFINAFSRSVAVPLGSVSLNPSEALGLLIIALGSLALVGRPLPVANLRPILVPLVLGNALLAGSSIAAGRLGTDSIATWVRSLGFLVLFLLAAASFTKERQVRRAVALFSWASLIPIGAGLYQAVSGTGSSELVRGDISRVFGTWNHPNPYSFYLLMVFALALVTLLDARAWPGRLLGGVWCALVLACLFLTYTRITWLGLVPAVLVISALRRNPWIPLGMALVAVLVLLFVPTAQKRLAEVETVRWQAPGLGGNSIEWRLAAWQQSRKALEGGLLLGHGANATSELLGFDAHNDYLAALIDGGVLGLGVQLWLQAALMAGSLRAWRRLRTPLYRRIALALLAVQVAFALMSLTDNLIGYFQLYAYHWIFVGMVCALPSIERRVGAAA